MIEQKVVRTFPNNYINPTAKLEALLDKGYVVVMCHEFEVFGGQNGLEYIVEKRIPEQPVSGDA